MKEKIEDLKDATGAEVFLAQKLAYSLRVRLENAQDAFGAAMESYAVGDPIVAKGLLHEALDAANAAKSIGEEAGSAARSIFEADRLAAHSLSNAIANILPCFETKLLLKLAKDEFAGKFKYKKEGSFKGKGSQVPTSIKDDSIMTWRFYVEKSNACDNICLISVFHFKGKDKKIVKPAKAGFSKSYVRAHTLPKHENTLPHGGEDVNGFGVDTPFYDPFFEQPVKCPCYPGQYRINNKGKKDKKAKTKHIGGYDPANAQATGFLQYFETAAVCIGKESFVILNSMKWRTDGKKAVFLDKDGNPTKSGKVQDLGDASPAFKRALLNWIRLMKKQHKIKGIECKKL